MLFVRFFTRIVWGFVLLMLLYYYYLLTVCYRVLARGSRLLCLWTSAHGAAAAAGSTGSRKRVPTERIVLQVSGGAVMILALFVVIVH